MASAEQKKSYQVVKQFKGLNTKANRTAIDEDEFSWLENAMPVGFANLKIVPNYTDLGITFSHTALNVFQANINLVDYIIVFESDGSAEYVNVLTATKGTLAPAGTFSATGNMRVSQWKNKYLLIGDPTKGYFTWDGTDLIAVGSVGLIGITEGGSGYTTAPFVQISAPNQANGTQATATCTITDGSGSITSVAIDNIGDNYTAVPTVTISAPNLSTGTQANAYASIQGGNVVAIGLQNGGFGYTLAPTVTISGGGGANANAIATIDTGAVNSISITEAGSGYTSAPTVSFVGGGGTNAAAVAGLLTFATGTIAVNVTNGGIGYTNAANLVITITGNGANAAAKGIISGGQVTQVVVTNPGNGYTTGNVAISGGGGTNASAELIFTSDTTTGIESFSGRVWIAQGRAVYYSAAGSATDFSSVSAGNVILADATLHGSITQILSANNFLYIFGDDSINVFSDVRVTNTGATLFTNTNISASVGTKLPYAIFPYFRSVLFMNSYGVYALVGSTTSKVSDALDGIMPNIDFVTSQVTSGQVLINNILCAAFNFKYTGGQGVSASSRYIQAVFFDKKWFLTSQTNDLGLITSSPAGGQTFIYGSNGANLLKFFNDKTSAIQSYIQTALMPMGDPIRTKQALKFAIEATGAAGSPINVTVDSENGSSPVVSLADVASWKNNSGIIIGWQNNSSTIILWSYTAGYYLYKSDAQQWGKYLGLTATSNAASYVVNSFEFEHELRVRF